MSLTELESERDRVQELLMAIDEDIASIKGQLEHAEIDRDRDPHWKVSATCALRHKSLARQRLQFDLGKLSRAIKTAQYEAADRRFAETAKKILPAETFNAILAEMVAA